MWLIAESGSSKTQWRILNQQTIISSETKGINPFFASKEFILGELESSGLAPYRSEIKKIIFYGSGCSHEDRNAFLRDIFKSYFTNAEEILVDHDMLAACIALFGHRVGIACIIGTGSNSCVYQQGSITHNVPALGYILGDEASGSYLGKEIVKHFIYHTLPADIHAFIELEFKVDKEMIFDAVYKKELPNRFLASFAKVAGHFRQDPFIQDILQRGFHEFIQYHLLCYPEARHLPIGFVGSIASVFESELSAALAHYQLKAAKIDSHPIDALVAFYAPQQ